MTIARVDCAHYATINACKLCTPLGACLAFRGIEGAIPFIHGSQGCATYIRRYLISHYNEPIDIATSSFGESSAVFGGEANFREGIHNVSLNYHPRLIGIATTCLTETIGEDMAQLIARYRRDFAGEDLPLLVSVSTPSYQGTHIEGFHAAVHALTDQLATRGTQREKHINLLPGMVSPADMRYLKEILGDFKVKYVLLPDYSDTLDGPAAEVYAPLSQGGTPVSAITSMGRAQATLEFGRMYQYRETAGMLLNTRYGVRCFRLDLPIGVKETDHFFKVLEKVSERAVPLKYRLERGRLIDAYVDGHKYVSGKRAIVYGEEDFVLGMAAFLAEIGMLPVLCASGGESGTLAQNLRMVLPELAEKIVVREGADFAWMEEEARTMAPDLLIGHSKGYALARRLGIPLIRVGFPIHDRLGGQRILHLGYRGAQQLYDSIVNTLIGRKQDLSPVGYSYM